MFKVPLYNFNYDWSFLNQSQNSNVKRAVAEIHQFLSEDSIIDFEFVSNEQLLKLERMREYLHSDLNAGSALVYHLINQYQINPRRSNKEEETSMLHFLCACGRLEDVIWLLENYPKVKLNTNSHIFQKPIQFAVALGDSPEITAYLLNKGAVVACFDNDYHDSYSLADALHLSWINSDDSEKFLGRWIEVLENDDVLNDIEEKYKDFFEEIFEYQLEALSSSKRIKR